MDRTNRKRALVEGGLVSVADACAWLGLKRSKVYELMSDGTLPYARFGRKRAIPKEALIEYAARNLVTRETLDGVAEG